MAAAPDHPGRGLDLGYARVSTTKQSLERQLDALAAAGIPAERIYTDKKTGATDARAGAEAKDRRIGRPLAHPPDKIQYARLLKGEGHTLGQIAAKTGIPKTSLHRYLAGNVPATGGGILRPEGLRAAGPNRRARGAAPEPVRRAADPAGAWHFPAGRNTHPLS